MTTTQKASTVDLAHFETLGRQAFEAGAPNFPTLNAEVYAAIVDLPVGGGAAPIMGAFSQGWHAANLAAPVDLDEDGE
jgi:hypothetical protein